MSERTQRSKAAEEREKRVEEMRQGLKLENGKSRLELLELDEDDAVYDLYDEEKYEKLVESRRDRNDFVVDDEGHGYYDDGEEHLGVAEDEYDHKKRLKEAAEDGDNKFAKKARKLAEAGLAQKNSILSFVKPGAPATSRINSSKMMTNDSVLDIDNLLQSIQANKTATAPSRPPTSISGARVAPMLGSGSKYRKPTTLARPLPILHPSVNSARSSYNGHNDYGNDNFESPMDFTDENENDNQSNENPITIHQRSSAGKHVTFANYQTPTDKLNNLASVVDRGLTTVTPGDSPEENLQPEPDVPITQQINLSKTTKKLSFAEPIRRPPDATFKPIIGDNTVSTGLMEICAVGSSPTDTPSSSCKASSIDPKLWLLRHTVENSSADNAGINSSDNSTASANTTEEYMEMFWLDACEANGVIYLFGKVSVTEPISGATSHVSACVIVHGVVRNLYALPRATGSFKADGTPERFGMAEVYQEVNQLLVPKIIPRSEGAAFRAKSVRRNYAFEQGDIPREETDYLKIVYSARHPAPSLSDCQGGKYIEKIFGHTCSPLELFLLKRELMGPCWITIRNPRMISDALSWCKIEIGVEDTKYISKLPANMTKASPPLISICVSMKTVLNPSSHLHEIVALSGMVHTKVDCDIDSDLDPKVMKRFTYIRPLGFTCGNNYPSAFPHDIQNEVKKAGAQGALLTLPNERALISSFFARVQQEDPDIFASHNLFGFEFDVLLSRALANKVTDWSRLGRLRRSKQPKSISDRDITSGRILCDTYKAAKEFLRETSYSLTSLSQSQLHCDRAEVDPIDVPKYFFNSADIVKIANHTAVDALLVQKLVMKLQIIPLTKQLTNLSGNLWSRTVRGARAERIEYLLLHEFHGLKYVLPERKVFESNDSKGALNNNVGNRHRGNADNDDVDEDEQKVGGTSRTRAKAAYAGGLVLEPKKGLYDTYILLLDFNSLYPSLIQEYNLCFTTIHWTKYMPDEKPKAITSGYNNASMKGVIKCSKTSNAVSKASVENVDEDAADEEDTADDGDLVATKSLPPLPDPDIKQGILPRVIRTLVDRRREVKNLLKKERDPTIRQSLDIRQKALKLTANSMYGCLGFAFSRFYARPIAALVTSMGREALQRTVDQATNQFGLEVIYGDTDSVMINTNSRDLATVKRLGIEVKNAVNKLYRSLELDIDGIFASMLLLKKKKYAAVSIKEVDDKIFYEKELKGLDLVRRDWCPLSKDAGKYVVDQILSGKPRDDIVTSIHEYLTELAKKVRSKEIDLAQFVVTKGLNKNPRDYPDTKGQPHLQVALAMLKANKPVNIGDHIPYVICAQDPTTPVEAAARAHHPDDVIRSADKITLDLEWYLTNQVLPPISRLCEPIEGTSVMALSQCMGLDSSKYARAATAVHDDLADEDWGFTPQCRMEDSERFKDCTKLHYRCASCKQECEFKSVSDASAGLNCSLCGAQFLGRMKPVDCYAYLSNRVTLMIRESLKRYYDCWYVCDEPTCHRRTMQLPVGGGACVGDCHGRMNQEYKDAQLHNQLKYLESLFRLKKVEDNDGEKREKIFLSNSVLSCPTDSEEVYRLLRHHLTFEVRNSAYNWVRPSLWTSIFGKLTIK